MPNYIKISIFLLFSLFSSIVFSQSKTHEELRESVFSHWNEIENWETQKFGLYNTLSNPSEYDDYTTDILKKLAQQNDLKALEVLGNRYLALEKNLEALSIFRQAAILGSTYALQSIAEILETSENDLGAKRVLLYSYLQAMLFRGDRSAIRFLGLVDEFLSYEGDIYMPLTNEQKKAIHKKGTDIYKQLVKARRLKGLSEFDRTPYPEFMNDYYQLVNWNFMHIVTGEVPLLLEKLPPQKK
jgi:hypothetical protein